MGIPVRSGEKAYENIIALACDIDWAPRLS